MIELLVFLVTGFAVSLAAWYLFEALPGAAIRFESRTIGEYGLLHSGIAYAFAGPVLALSTIITKPAGFSKALAGISISILWSVALGMTIIGIVLSF